MPRPKLEFAWASLQAARDAGIEDLTILHWEEIEHHKDASPLELDWAGYRALEQSGRLRIGLLKQDGRLIGYNAFYLHRPLHHRGTLWAISDSIYLDPAHRRGWAGVLMIKEAERLLKAEGAKVILVGEKPDRNLSSSRQRASLGLLLEKLGYGAFEHTWSKAL